MIFGRCTSSEASRPLGLVRFYWPSSASVFEIVHSSHSVGSLYSRLLDSALRVNFKKKFPFKRDSALNFKLVLGFIMSHIVFWFSRVLLRMVFANRGTNSATTSCHDDC